MAKFKVIEVIDGDTFDVSPNWRWNGEEGCRVRPTGYDAPELNAYGGQAAKQKLERLILLENVDLQTAYRIDRGRLICDVFFNSKNLADFYPEYQ